MNINYSRGVGRVDFVDENTTRLEPFHILITGGSRIAGKSMFVEQLAWLGYTYGCTVICLSDFKDKTEMGFCMFEPTEKYHIDKLKKWGVPIKKIPAKLYHPFTFDIPDKEIPETNFYTINIKTLQRQELSFIGETKQDTASIKILLDRINHLKKNEGLHHLIYYAEEMTEPNIKHGKPTRNIDPDSFFTKGSQGGNQKNIPQIIGYFKPFQHDYFLTPENCPLNLDMEKILNDQKHYHILITKYIKDTKIKAFIQDNFLHQIILNADKSKYPIIIVVDELRSLVPQSPEGFEVFMAENIKKYWSTMGSMAGSEEHGGGISSISATQVYWDVNTTVANSMTKNFFGRTEALADIEKIAKALRLSTDDLHQLLELKKGQFVCNDLSKYSEPFNPFLPPHRHAEVGYKFEEHFKREYPDKMKNYTELKKTMQTEKTRIENELKKLVEQDNMRIQEIHQQKEKNKLERQEEKIKDETKKILQKKSVQEDINLNQARIWKKEYEEGQTQTPKTSFRSLALKYHVSKNKIARAIERVSTNDHADESTGQENHVPPQKQDFPK